MNIIQWLSSKLNPAPKSIAEVVDESAKIHNVKASSFADPADVRAFKRAKAQGMTDKQAFAVGDNGIGLWGDDTTSDTPMCALPPEEWNDFYHTARGKRVMVAANGRTVICELRDTMPHEKNIRNGAGIDLNPAAVRELHLVPPIMISAAWKWV